MIKVYEKNGLFIIQDTIIDIIYPNLTKQEAINLLVELGRTSDRVDNAIKDFNENNFQYESLEVDKTRLKYLEQQLAEKDKEIKNLQEKNNWLSMWHKKFQKEIEDLKTELETYRPTHLKGNGQCQCAICKQINWTDWCIKYDGKTYCDGCFKQVETRDDKLRHQVCDEIREKLKAHCDYTDEENISWYLTEDKIDMLLDQIKKGGK